MLIPHFHLIGRIETELIKRNRYLGSPAPLVTYAPRLPNTIPIFIRRAPFIRQQHICLRAERVDHKENPILFVIKRIEQQLDIVIARKLCILDA